MANLNVVRATPDVLRTLRNTSNFIPKTDLSLARPNHSTPEEFQFAEKQQQTEGYEPKGPFDFALINPTTSGNSYIKIYDSSDESSTSGKISLCGAQALTVNYTTLSLSTANPLSYVILVVDGRTASSPAGLQCFFEVNRNTFASTDPRIWRYELGMIFRIADPYEWKIRYKRTPAIPEITGRVL